MAVIVDGLIGFRHPNRSDVVYPVDYGYVPGIMESDGEYRDAYILDVDSQVLEFIGVVIAIVHRHNDIEDKWGVAAPGHRFSKEQIAAQIHFQEQFFQSEIILSGID